jgi:glucosylceramidase
MSQFQMISSNPERQWREIPPSNVTPAEVNLELTGVTYQPVEGFGGCFNELSWIALKQLPEEIREKIMDILFTPDGECSFNFGRLPIGASDYAAEWYSHNEFSGDYSMEKFSIARDQLYLIPYIKAALKRRNDLKLFASPWSPPTWMKFPKAYNYGTMIWSKENLSAYALYLLKFVQAYQEAGIHIRQLHVQNEPAADQKFPSCLWTGEQLREFIRDYLGPLFERSGVATEIWLGTINSGAYDSYVHSVLSDPPARRFISGVGYQWAGKEAAQRTYESWPELGLMQTENECGDGQNTWEYAHYVFNLFRHYFSNGVRAYIYWNMVLPPEGQSTWGWKQNSLITVRPDTREVIFNPEFYVMKHFAHFVKPGAVRLGLKGPWTGNALAFKNPNGEIIIILNNPFSDNRRLSIQNGTTVAGFELKPYSINSILILSRESDMPKP